MHTSQHTVKALWRVTKVILETLEFADVAQKICDSLLTELGFLDSGYRIIVLSLYRDDFGGLQRVALSQTPEAKAAIDASPIPFHDIIIPIDATENYCVKAFLEKKPYVTTDWKDILSPPLRPMDARGNQQAAGIRTSMVFPVVLKKKPVGVVIFSMIKERGDVTQEEIDLIANFTDIIGIAVQNAKLYSDLEAASLRLQAGNEKLMELDKLKDEFISITSHELRTPMTAIKGYLWLLLREKAEPLPPKAKEYLERVYTSSERLIAMVNDMLDVSRIESGKIKLTRQSCNIVLLAEEIQQLFLGRAMQKGLTIRVRGGNDVPLVSADREKLHQTLENLVGNALKFTPKGGKITLSVKNGFTRNPAIGGDSGQKAVMVAVSDTGVGMKKEDIPKLFKKFGRIDNTLVPRPGVGTGLGLYICKQFVSLHGGRIDVDSAPNRGTTFTITLPLK